MKSDKDITKIKKGDVFLRHSVVFQAIVVSRILYALPGWGPFLSKELTGRINAFLKRAFRYGFATKIMEVNSLLDSESKDLFCNMQRSYHCLFSILRVETPHDHKLRERGHNFVFASVSK